MAEHDDDQDRTEQPTEKKLREAREKGDVPRSRDLSGALVVLAGVIAVMDTAGSAMERVRKLFSLGLSYDHKALMNGDLPAHVFTQCFSEFFHILAPVALATILAAFAAPILIGGFNISGEALVPKFERLNPIEGFGRIFSMRGLVELAKSLVKILFIGGVLILVLRHWQGQLMVAGKGDGTAGMIGVMHMMAQSAVIFGGVLAFLGGLDALYQKFDHNKRLRMTRQEIKDEHKETDGDPHLKARIRQTQASMAKRRMMEKLPKADVVITNPEHFAVALQYQDGSDRAPVVVAKGLDELALQIRFVASGHKIPIVEAPPLARALYATTRLDREIPSQLYVAVAEILAYVYRLQQVAKTGEAKPKLPTPPVDPTLMGPYKL